MFKKIQFKSLYIKLSVTFIEIFWIVNFVSSGIIFRFFTGESLQSMILKYPELIYHFKSLRDYTSLTLFLGYVLGTLAILKSTQRIIIPIKKLSKATHEITQGNFDVKIETEGKDEIAQLTQDFNFMITELKGIDQLKKNFISDVSHEFKTPVTSIKGFAKLIKSGDLSQKELTEYCDIIIEESDHLSKLAQDLLSLSEIESEHIQKNLQTISLDESLRKTIALLDHLRAAKEIELDLDLESIQMVMDEHHFIQLTTNLLSNAYKFSKPKGKVMISLKRINDSFQLMIKDEGIGISEVDMTHLFERFYQADRSRSTEGHGLGLVIVKTLVDKMDGQVQVQSEVDQGTTITLEIPLKRRN